MTDSISVVMVPELLKDNGISFNPKQEDKMTHMNSLEVAHWSNEVLEMLHCDFITGADLGNLVPDSNSKNGVFSCKLIQNFSEPFGNIRVIAHFSPISLSSSSSDILRCGPFIDFFNSSINSGFIGISSTGC
ncbi:MAG TPA: hypothetical protein VFF28_05060, partial [Candidatus Nanoarchaeia archaeon]|nr:hypothetical protein [Candidatus Nanoarchaeia archaeon]